MKAETFICVLAFLVGTACMLISGTMGPEMQIQNLVSSLVLAVSFMVLYRTDNNHPKIFTFYARYLALGLAFVCAKLSSVWSCVILATIYIAIDAYIPVIGYHCGWHCRKEPVIRSQMVILYIITIMIVSVIG